MLAEELDFAAEVFADAEISIVNGVEIAFYRETHTYMVNGVAVPSVTTVIGEVWPELYEHTKEYAMWRGSVVHELIHRSITTGDREFYRSNPFAGYVEAAHRFIEESRAQVISSERRVYSKAYNYPGTLDIDAIVDGVRTITDWKSGNPGWQCGLQTAAYAHALQEETGEVVKKRLGVWLHQDGTYQAIPYKNFREDFADFCSALRVLARRRQIR